MNKYNLYNVIYDWTYPISFLLFSVILIIGSILQNENTFIIGFSILILINIFAFIYMWLFPFEHLNERFVLWRHSFNKYKLTPDEIKLWNSIIDKADIGYAEWYAETQRDDLCGPWLKNYTEEENNLIDKIHEYFYGKHWYISLPISAAQVNYVMYTNIKDKVN